MAVLKKIDTANYSNIKTGWYLAYYHSTKEQVNDPVSQYLLDFKRNIEPITSKWIRLASSFFKDKFKPDLIIRVLASSETIWVNGSSIDKLGHALDIKNISKYRPRTLYKIRTTRPLKVLNKHEREEEVKEVYRFVKPDFQVKSVLLLDDILTSGTTINEIKRAISVEIADIDLYLFVMGKTYDSWRDQSGDNSETKSSLEKV